MDADAARFFAAGPSAGPSALGPAPYDLAALHGALSPLQAQSPAAAQSPGALSPGAVMSPAPAAPWAADFLQQQPARSPLPQTEQSATHLRQAAHAPLERVLPRAPR